MNKKREDILQYLFNKTSPHKFVTLYELEVEFGLSGWDMRSCLEDLKEAGLVVEAVEGFAISMNGVNIAKTKWI